MALANLTGSLGGVAGAAASLMGHHFWLGTYTYSGNENCMDCGDSVTDRTHGCLLATDAQKDNLCDDQNEPACNWSAAGTGDASWASFCGSDLSPIGSCAGIVVEMVADGADCGVHAPDVGEPDGTKYSTLKNKKTGETVGQCFWDRANMAQVSCANWGSSLKEVVFRCDTNIKCN